MLLYARLLITVLMFIEFGIVAWYLLYWDLFSRYSIKRLGAWVIYIISVVAIPLLQIGIYREITSVNQIEDFFVFLVIWFESFVSVVLIFGLLLRRRFRKRRSEQGLGSPRT